MQHHIWTSATQKSQQSASLFFLYDSRTPQSATRQVQDIIALTSISPDGPSSNDIGVIAVLAIDEARPALTFEILLSRRSSCNSTDMLLIAGCSVQAAVRSGGFRSGRGGRCYASGHMHSCDREVVEFEVVEELGVGRE